MNTGTQVAKQIEEANANVVVDVRPAVAACITHLVTIDEQKRSFEYWADFCLQKGYEYAKRLHEEAQRRAKAKKAETDRAQFHEFISRNPQILADKAQLLKVAKSYNQLDDMLVKALSAETK